MSLLFSSTYLWAFSWRKLISTPDHGGFVYPVLIQWQGFDWNFLDRGHSRHSPHAVVFLSLPSSWRPLLSFLSQSTCRGICRIECNHKRLSQLLRSIGGHEALMSRRKHELTCLLCLLAECQHLAEKQKKTKRVKLRANRHHFLQGCTYLLPPFGL